MHRSTPFHDHFSGHAAAYARHRPRYPACLFAWLAQVSPGQQRALDCATGNGQAAIALAAHFAEVFATDASPQQLAAATPHDRVTYATAPAEACPLDADSVDLVTVAQALHWLDRDAFYAQAERVLRPSGVLAAWCYQLATVAPPIDDLINHYYTATVGTYWPPERALVEQGYASIGPPWTRLDEPTVAMTCEWTAQQMLGYLASWSASQRAAAATGDDPLAALRPALSQQWGAHTRTVRWPLQLNAWRRP